MTFLPDPNGPRLLSCSAGQFIYLHGLYDCCQVGGLLLGPGPSSLVCDLGIPLRWAQLHDRDICRHDVMFVLTGKLRSSQSRSRSSNKVLRSRPLWWSFRISLDARLSRMEIFLGNIESFT
jgi:hypothetical protein